jgi:hypothetical protein
VSRLASNTSKAAARARLGHDSWLMVVKTPIYLQERGCSRQESKVPSVRVPKCAATCKHGSRQHLSAVWCSRIMHIMRGIERLALLNQR